MADLTLELLQMHEVEADEEGAWFGIGELTEFDAELVIANILDSGSAEVVIEAAPIADEDHARELHTFGVQSTENTFTATQGTEYTIAEQDRYLRGIVKDSVTGKLVLRLRVTGPVLDLSVVTDDNLLPKKLRDFSDKQRLVDQAHDDVIGLITDERRIIIDLAWVGVIDALKAEIATQSWHLFNRERLSKDRRPAAQKALSATDTFAPDLGSRLTPYLNEPLATWRGR